MEELKIVLQTLSQLADGAKEAFIWWLVIDRLVPVLMLSAFGGGVIGAAWYLIRRAIDASNSKEEAVKAIKIIRSIVGVYSYQSIQADRADLDSSDYSDTVDAVRKLTEHVAVANAKKMAADTDKAA